METSRIAHVDRLHFARADPPNYIQVDSKRVSDVSKIHLWGAAMLGLSRSCGEGGGAGGGARLMAPNKIRANNCHQLNSNSSTMM